LKPTAAVATSQCEAFTTVAAPPADIPHWRCDFAIRFPNQRSYYPGMANTFTSLQYHIVFGTKNREPWIRQDIEQRVWSCLGGVARENDMKALLVGGIENHVHLLLGIPAKLSVSQAIQLIKGASSGWMNETLPGLGGFAWQDGYAAFTVSKSQVPDVEEYVRYQREHHRVKTFEEEYRAFLDKHEIECKEEYVFG
jgi:REP-associated tyrosine transposase